MNIQLKTMIYQRYGKPVLILCVLLFAVYGIYAARTVNGWHSSKNYYYSDQYKKDFYEFSDDSEIDKNQISDKDIQAEAERNLYLFNENYYYSSYYYEGNPIINDDVHAFNNETVYVSSYLAEPVLLVYLVCLLGGFLLFFVDLKTHFTAFLFSSGFSRKQLFLSKLLYVVLPVFLTLFLGKLLILVSTYLSIPHEYINAPFSAIALSCISSLSVAFLLFSCGCFIGGLTGNLVMGPIMLALFTGTVYNFPEVFLDQVYTVLNFIRSLNGQYNIKYDYRDMSGHSIVFSIGKTSGHWYTVAGALGLSLLLLAGAWYGFKHLSLERGNAFIPCKKLVLPLWTLVSLYGSFFVLHLQDPLRWYLYQLSYENWTEPSALMAVVDTVILVLITFAVCGFFFYFAPLRRAAKRVRQRFSKHQPI